MPTAPGWRPRRPVALLFVVSAALAAVSAFTTMELRASPAASASSASTATVPFSALRVGERAPQVMLAEADASQSRVTLPEISGLTLVSFLATQPDTAGTPSRSQAVELASLANQYATQGLHVLIIDDSAASVPLSTLINTSYDWRLGAVPLLADPGHVTARRYGVSSAPTSLLIDRAGTVIQRWDGYTLTAAVAQAVAAAH